ncbi:hypothetical protein ACIQVC_37210 [Streptomyces sp. NPDC101112]|uniref:hypothetical protein n=1 Tax=Streptomyces sp. NPDC101112 TaxID=3366105 RepID=UPI00382F7AB5
MTAPTAPRVPTPGDLARRPAPPAPTKRAQPVAARPGQPYTPRTLTPAEALAPGRIGKRERLRNLFTHGLRISRMRPHARLVALTLLPYANDKTGLLTPAHRPTIEQLADNTGLLPAQVHVQLQVLTQRGWLYSRPIAEGPHAGKVGLCLAVPAGVLEQLRAARAQAPTPAPAE